MLYIFVISPWVSMMFVHPPCPCSCYICTINILYHIRPLTWGTCALYPSYIVRLIANSLYAHGSCECVGDTRYDEYPWCIFTPDVCIPNNMHLMYDVPQLATTISQSQPLSTKYCAKSGSLAVISMSQRTECMAMIWHVAITYRCPTCI